MNIEESDNPAIVRLLQLAGADVSSTARLVAVAEALGITSPTDVAKLVGKKPRMVRHARQEIAECGNGLPAIDCQRQQIAGNGLPRAATDCLETAADCRPSRTRARAQKESPSEIDSLKEVSKSRETEIDGLNGSTQLMIGWLADWLKGDHGIEDRTTARAIIEGNVAAYGAEKVLAGCLELKAATAAGKKFPDKARAFSSYVKHAKPAASDASLKFSKADSKASIPIRPTKTEAQIAAENEEMLRQNGMHPESNP